MNPITVLSETVREDVTALKALDPLLFALTASSGAIDAISFLALGKVFTAFMTGNTVFLGLRIAGESAPTIDALLASMGAFAAGVFLSTRLFAPGDSSARRLRRVLSALGLSLIGHAVFIALWLAYHAQPSRPIIPALLASWALAMGMQTGAVRALQAGSVLTTAATPSFIGLVAGLAHWRLMRVEIHRLGFILLFTVFGATAGGLLLRHAPRAAPVLPFVITATVVLVAHRKWSRG